MVSMAIIPILFHLQTVPRHSMIATLFTIFKHSAQNNVYETLHLNSYLNQRIFTWTVRSH